MGQSLRLNCLPEGQSGKGFLDSTPAPPPGLSHIWGPFDRSAAPLPRPRRSRFDAKILRGRSGCSLQILSGLHLECVQSCLELPARPSSSLDVLPVAPECSHISRSQSAPGVSQDTKPWRNINKTVANDLFMSYLNPGARFLALLGDIGKSWMLMPTFCVGVPSVHYLLLRFLVTHR